MKELIARVADRTLDPYVAVEEVLAKIGLWGQARARAIYPPLSDVVPEPRGLPRLAGGAACRRSG